MWFVHAALRRPLTVLILAAAIVAGALLSLPSTKADIFPSLGVPVIYVVQPYGGLSPAQIEGQVTGYYEFHFLYINGIEHIESQSIQGMAMLKLYFHPGTDIAQSMAQVTAMAFRATSFMPPGTLPPFIVRFDTGSVPVGQLVFSSDQRSETEVQDVALYKVRPVLATLPGVSAPPPSGGKVRLVAVYVDPDRLRAYRMSADEVATAVAKSNLTLPAGNVRIGDQTAIASMNAMVPRIADLESIPIRTGSGPTVYLRDVARVEDGADVVTNVATINGRHTVYMPLTKRADASTLDVVQSIRDAMPKMQAQAPDDVKLSFEFDQSIFVKTAIRGLVSEGLLGAILTGLTVLLFLRSWRSALIVVVTIPLSILAAIIALRVAGQTANLMTLSGLSLAVGILVDEATVAIESIHRHLAEGKGGGRAVVDAMSEVMQPRLLAMLCVLAVFIPAFFMVGVGRSLFPPLALAVGFSMVASYLVSSTVVPVLAALAFKRPVRHVETQGALGRLYVSLVGRVVRARWLVALAYLAACIPAVVLVGRLGTELFPRVDTGQFQVKVRAPAGTRLERTEDLVHDTEAVIREVVGAEHVRVTLANIGNPPWTYPVNALYTFNAGPHEATLLVALQGERLALPELQEALRKRLAERHPEVKYSFEAGDIVSQVLNFGAPTPISLTISGKSLKDTRQWAQKLMAGLGSIPELRDVQLPIALDYPSVDIELDRERAGQFGVTVERIGRSVVAATSSSVLTTPIFWTDPATGQPYRVSVRVPESQLASMDDVANLPVMGDGESQRPLLSDVATVRRGTTVGEVDHYNSQRTLTVTANLAGDDLGRAAADVDRVVKSLGEPPKGISVALRGQAEQMRTTLSSLRDGLALAVLVVLLLLAANFQSLRESLVVLSTVPAVLIGVVVMLWLTHTSLNVQSLMGAIMAIGVSVANAVLLVTFARNQWRSGATRIDAAIEAARSRARPILMTSVAMVFGMVPTALALGEGASQSAPLGLAVIGGLFSSTLATLLILPASFVLLGGTGAPRPISLHPDEAPSTSVPREVQPVPLPPDEVQS